MPGNRGKREAPTIVLLLLLTLSIVGIDQYTKHLALRYLEAGATFPIIPDFFHLTLLYNTGIAFGLFRAHPTLLVALISVSLAFLVYLKYRLKQAHILVRVGLALIVGGAIGNWVDRLRYGAVVDFLDFRVWPIFNVADSAITIGVCLYIILLWTGRVNR
ncbi:MAG: signal peptidase II [Candidatus Omnitrophota bacterium]|nr:signal peptidase II [Candidatus Omnitrophota bacterium]